MTAVFKFLSKLIFIEFKFTPEPESDIFITVLGFKLTTLLFEGFINSISGGDKSGVVVEGKIVGVTIGKQ